MQSGLAVAATAVHHEGRNRPCVAGDDGGIPQALKKYVDGSAQLPVKTYFIGGYGEWLWKQQLKACLSTQHAAEGSQDSAGLFLCLLESQTPARGFSTKNQQDGLCQHTHL